MAEWVWMKHPDGSEPAPFAADAVEFWQARGWERVEKPAEPDPTAEPQRRPAEWSPSAESVEKVRALLPHVKARTRTVSVTTQEGEQAEETTTGAEPVATITQRTAGRQRRVETEEN